MITKKEVMYIDKSKWRIFTDSLVAGVGSGIGAALGVAALFAVIGFIASRVQAVPYIGEFVYNVVNEVEKLRTR